MGHKNAGHSSAKFTRINSPSSACITQMKSIKSRKAMLKKLGSAKKTNNKEQLHL